MERLGPPFEGGDAEPWDGGGVVGELVDLFLEGEKGNEGVSSCGDGE